MARTLRVAAAQYPLEEVTSVSAFEAKLGRWVREAAADGAQLLVFPEYAGLELSRVGGRHISRDLQASINALQYYLRDYDEAHAALAKEHRVHILAGSAPVRLTDGRFVNRARLFTPTGATGFQQKHIMTRFEAEQWSISASAGLCVFDIGLAKLGIAICYDAEFPLIARALAEAGAEVLLVPSCTEAATGYYRVRNACAARALENQFYTVHAPTVGEAPWLAALDTNVGAAAFFAPPDRRFSDNGVIAEGRMNAPQWVYATLDLDLIAEARHDGEVLNNRNWDCQPGASPLPPAKVIVLN